MNDTQRVATGPAPPRDPGLGSPRGTPELRLRVETWRALEAIGDATARGQLCPSEARRAAVTLVHAFYDARARDGLEATFEAWFALYDASEVASDVWQARAAVLDAVRAEDHGPLAATTRCVHELVRRRVLWLGESVDRPPQVARPQLGICRALSARAWVAALEAERLAGVVDDGTRRAVVAVASNHRAPWSDRVRAFVELAHPAFAASRASAVGAALRARWAWERWPDSLDGARLAVYVAAAEHEGVIRPGEVDVSMCAPVPMNRNAAVVALYGQARTPRPRVSPTADQWTSIFPSLSRAHEPTTASRRRSFAGSVSVAKRD